MRRKGLVALGRPRRAPSKPLLRRGLERLRRQYDARYLAHDPLEFPHRFRSRQDREVIALFASAIAYGNVTSIRQSLEKILAWLGPHPARRLRALEPRSASIELAGFHHRWSRGQDVACLAVFIRQMLEESGSIGGFFRRTYRPEDRLARSLSRFCRRTLSLDHGGIYESVAVPPRAGVRYFFPLPELGSACKRLNMFLRWMVRPDDGLDLGLWKFMHTRQLIIPLDTHMIRIGHHLGWTRRRTPGWKMAEEITTALARVDPGDPVKYDFALSRMGILEGCPRHRRRTAEGQRGKQCELCRLRREMLGA